MRRRGPPEPDGEVVLLLQGLGRMLMAIDAKLARVVELLEMEYGDG
jgi:hypothetical protein